MSARPVIAISLGDPGGIGPEITAKTLANPSLAAACTPVVYGPRSAWARGCAIAGIADTLPSIAHAGEARGPSLVEIESHPLDAFPWGAGDLASGRAQMRSLERAVDDVLAGRAAGLCTAPVNKAAVHRFAAGFSGHTEYLQERFGVPRVVMLMAGERLRVALVTTHVALSRVPELATADEIFETTRLTARELATRFGLVRPKIAVCGLNPHAGEEGRFGDEELRTVRPAIERCRAEGLDVSGPYAADGIFPRAVEQGFDAVVALYHDQGLIPFKMVEFHAGVNVTLGLPRPRTSPDHGVAYDIAGKGLADARSMESALALCVRLAGARSAA